LRVAVADVAQGVERRAGRGGALATHDRGLDVADRHRRRERPDGELGTGDDDVEVVGEGDALSDSASRPAQPRA